jgi:hypothetical protein
LRTNKIYRVDKQEILSEDTTLSWWSAQLQKVAVADSMEV